MTALIKKVITMTSIVAIVLVSTGLSFENYVFAVSDNIVISQSVATQDITPPTVPMDVFATVSSNSEIEITWSASSDATGVDYYNIFRNASFIASTTLTNYMDTGLSEGTSYSYTVSAVDIAGNESARSSASTATISVIDVPTPPIIGNGWPIDKRFALLITDVVIETTAHEVTISWVTNNPAKSKISWGETFDEELGSLSEDDASNIHKTKIGDLNSATKYYFSILVKGPNGMTAGINNYQFETRPEIEDIPPTNPGSFTAQSGQEGIDLSWKNPTQGFKEVRIVRSPYFFPEDPNDGKLIYEGSAERYVDKDIEEGTKYYYTAFSKNSKGEYSSGVVAIGSFQRTGIVEHEDPFKDLPESEVQDILLDDLKFSDFDFIQNGRKISSIDELVKIDGKVPLTISLDYDKIPQVLKTIGITLSDSDDKTKTLSFLLRINKDKTRYMATVGAINKEGVYPINMTVLDFKNSAAKRLKGNMIVTYVQSGGAQQFIDFIFGQKLSTYFYLLLAIILLLILNRKKIKSYYKNNQYFLVRKNLTSKTQD